MSVTISIIHLPVWEEISQYLHVVEAAQDGGTNEDPRIRIEFLGLSEAAARRLVNTVLPCVHCGADNFCLRKRETDNWDVGRLYYAPACPLARRVGCSRGRAAELEYERFKAYVGRNAVLYAQLSLFG
jgi:hypothetical protein